MATTALLPPVNGVRLPSSRCLSFSTHHHSATTSVRWGWRIYQDAGEVTYRTRGQASRILANPNVSSGKGGKNYDVIMVDPIEAKRLAAKEMEKIKAKEKFKRRRQVEAINGAWAMIGLTAGLVIEGQTGKSILTQVSDYFGAVFHLFLP